MKEFNILKPLILLFALFISINSNARGPRKDLNADFNDAQRKEMCELLDAWLTTYLITMHGNDFARMHTTNDYLRWHRDHFIDLERFILEQDPNGTKGYDQYVPFPKWDPSKVIPSYFNGFDASGGNYDNISSKCGGGSGCRTREDYKNTNPGYKFNQSGFFTTSPNINIPLPSRYSPSGTLCSFIGTDSNWGGSSRTFDFSDMADFSDNQQYLYHNRGHVAFDRGGYNDSTFTNGYFRPEPRSCRLFILGLACMD